MKKFIVGLTIIAMAALSLSADIYIKSKSHTDAMSVMGQNTPATDTVSEAWISDNVFFNRTGDNGIIIDAAKKVFIMVNYGSKTYVEAALPLDFSKLLPPEMSAMASMIIMSAKVSPSGETKKIGSWNCQGYTMVMSIMGMPITTKVWASTDVPFDTVKFNAKFMVEMAKGMMRLDDASAKEMAKIKGYQIASETSGEIMGAKMRSTTEVVEISKKSAPAGVYAVPAGFKKTDFINMADIQR
ncbi:MAG: hypothetical protein JW843_08170 [Candidatus Aminicenantes bacterium]|nr:hypothetical protein [Candidatus Aminicenantes bacterium]